MVTRRADLTSSVNTGSTVRHAVASKIIITVQSFVILSLTYWIAEEYLNNMYLRQYVGDAFAANGLIIGALGVLLVGGFLGSLMLAKRRQGERRFGAVSLEITSSTPKPKLVAEPSAKPSEVSAKPSADFHPVVAALKADMADRRLSFGSMLGSSSEQSVGVTSPRPEVQKTSVLDQLASNRSSPTPGPMPGQVGALHPPRPMPVLQSQQAPGSNVLQAPQRPAPQMPTNITTVITGIMPVQKKKDPNDSTEDKSSSQ